MAVRYCVDCGIHYGYDYDDDMMIGIKHYHVRHYCVLLRGLQHMFKYDDMEMIQDVTASTRTMII